MPGPWGPAIARLRLQRGLSKKTVAKRAKMTATTYGRIEKGQHTQTRKLQSIAEVFAVDIVEVLGAPLISLPQDDRAFDAFVARVRDKIAAQSVSAPIDYDQTMRNAHQYVIEKEAASDREAGRQHPKRLGRKK